jgi:hypothetical protein
MKELFPHNDIKLSYKFFLEFLQNKNDTERISGKIHKQYFEIFFHYDFMKQKLIVKNFDKGGYGKLELTFYPFIYSAYTLSGWEINSKYLDNLFKLCNYRVIPRCRKCGAYPIKYYEEHLDKTTYKSDLTGNPFKNTNIEHHYSFPSYLKLTAECTCGNKWNIRNIISAHQVYYDAFPDLYALDLGGDSEEDYTEYKMDLSPSESDGLTKFENEKKPKRTEVLSQKEINALLNAINAGGEDD